ncbi:hypothetical protein SNF32_09465 [Enterococcus mundtii]|nr:hypothetical protein [Enterococcus mundtii]
MKPLDAHINAIIDGTDQPLKEGFRQKVKVKSQRFGGTVKTVKDRIFLIDRPLKVTPQT